MGKEVAVFGTAEVAYSPCDTSVVSALVIYNEALFSTICTFLPMRMLVGNKSISVIG